MKRIIISILLFSTALSSGCSVVMATWDDTEDLNLVHMGASREDIEDDFGAPEAAVHIENGVVNTYEIELEPLGYPTPGKRAFYYFYSGLATWGLSEWWNMPQEASWEANFEIHITFDSDGKVIEFSEPVCLVNCDSRTWVKKWEINKLGSWGNDSLMPTYTWVPEPRSSSVCLKNCPPYSLKRGKDCDPEIYSCI